MRFLFLNNLFFFSLISIAFKHSFKGIFKNDSYLGPNLVFSKIILTENNALGFVTDE